MALLCVQAKKIEAVSTTVTTNSAWTTTTGNLVVAGISAFSSNSSANHVCSDNTNGTYTKVRDDNSGASATNTSLHYKQNITGSTANLTANGGAGTAAIVGLFHEVSGASTTAAFTTGEANGTNGAPTTNPQTTAVTNATANSIFFAILSNTGPGTTETLTVNSTGSTPTGWALKNSTNSQEVNGSAFQTASMPFLIVSSGASTKHGWTTGNQNFSCSIACWIQATGGAQDTPELYGRPFGTRGESQMQQLLAQ